MIRFNETNNTYDVTFSYINDIGNCMRICKEGLTSLKAARDYELMLSAQYKQFCENEELYGTPQTCFKLLCDKFLCEKQKEVKFGTYRGYEQVIRRFLLPYFSNYKIEEISVSMIRGWQKCLDELRYSQQYLRRIDTIFVSVMNFAVKFYGVTGNPVIAAGTMGTSKASGINFWTIEEYRTFIKEVGDPILKLCFDLLFWSGIRVGELLALTPSDINFVNKSITISKTFLRYHKTDLISEPKTQKSNRTVFIPQSIIEDILNYLSVPVRYTYSKRYSPAYSNNLASPHMPKSFSSRSLASSRLFPFSVDLLRNTLNRCAKSAGLKRIRIHDLRHSHASMLVDMNITPLLISDRLGHEKVKTTLEIYSHLYPGKQKELAEELEKMRRYCEK